jgi:hypothetical protein
MDEGGDSSVFFTPTPAAAVVDPDSLGDEMEENELGSRNNSLRIIVARIALAAGAVVGRVACILPESQLFWALSLVRGSDPTTEGDLDPRLGVDRSSADGSLVTEKISLGDSRPNFNPLVRNSSF